MHSYSNAPHLVNPKCFKFKMHVKLKKGSKLKRLPTAPVAAPMRCMQWRKVGAKVRFKKTQPQWSATARPLVSCTGPKEIYWSMRPKEVTRTLLHPIVIFSNLSFIIQLISAQTECQVVFISTEYTANRTSNVTIHARESGTPINRLKRKKSILVVRLQWGPRVPGYKNVPGYWIFPRVPEYPATRWMHYYFSCSYLSPKISKHTSTS